MSSSERPDGQNGIPHELLWMPSDYSFSCVPESGKDKRREKDGVTRRFSIDGVPARIPPIKRPGGGSSGEIVYSGRPDGASCNGWHDDVVSRSESCTDPATQGWNSVGRVFTLSYPGKDIVAREYSRCSEWDYTYKADMDYREKIWGRCDLKKRAGSSNYELATASTMHKDSEGNGGSGDSCGGSSYHIRSFQEWRQGDRIPSVRTHISSPHMADGGRDDGSQTSPCKRPRLGWGQGLAKYEKKITGGANDSYSQDISCCIDQGIGRVQTIASSKAVSEASRNEKHQPLKALKVKPMAALEMEYRRSTGRSEMEQSSSRKVGNLNTSLHTISQNRLVQRTVAKRLGAEWQVAERGQVGMETTSLKSTFTDSLPSHGSRKDPNNGGKNLNPKKAIQVVVSEVVGSRPDPTNYILTVAKTDNSTNNSNSNSGAQMNDGKDECDPCVEEEALSEWEIDNELEIKMEETRLVHPRNDMEDKEEGIVGGLNWNMDPHVESSKEFSSLTLQQKANKLPNLGGKLAVVLDIENYSNEDESGWRTVNRKSYHHLRGGGVCQCTKEGCTLLHPC